MGERQGAGEENGRGPTDAGDLIAFGQFTFRQSTGELHRQGHAVRLAPKPTEVLRVLLGSAGSLVTRREIELAVWGDVPIDLDRSLNFAIRQIRSALGDGADSPRFIETLPKRGYRFIAPVSGGPRPDAPTELASREGRWPSRTAGAGALLLLATAVALLAAGGWPFGGTASEVRRMLAVLPLDEAASAEEPPYFASGLTDELITRLARLDPARLGVIARTSSRRAARTRQVDADVARDLQADYLLRGRVTRADGMLRVSVRLVRGGDGAVVWADRYVEPGPASLDLEFEIARRVADALRERLIPDLAPVPPTARPRRVSAVGRDAYLRGGWLLRAGRARATDAEALFREALAEDSLWAEAHAALGRSLLTQDRDEEGRRHLARALALDSSLPEPHVSLAVDAFYTLWAPDTARHHFERALELDPGNVLTHHPYAYFLSIMEDHDGAIREMEEALRLDPVSPLVNGDVGRIYYRARRFDEAERQCLRTLELQPTHRTALSCLVNLHLLSDDPVSARPFALRLLEADGADSTVVRRVTERPAAEAMDAFFHHRVTALSGIIERGGFAHVALAQAHVWLGQTDEALSALERALERRSPILPQVPGDPCFAVLRDEPRFQAVIAAMGIP